MAEFVFTVSNAADSFIAKNAPPSLMRSQEADTPIEAIQQWMVRMMLAGFVFEDPLPMDAPSNTFGWGLVSSNCYSAWRARNDTVNGYKHCTADEKAQIRAWLSEWTGRVK